MGTWQFTLGFKAHLQIIVGNRGDLAAVGTTDYYGVWANAAYLDLCTKNKFWDLKIPKKFYFPELETSETKTTTAGTATIAMPTTALIIREVYDTTNNVRLSEIPFSKYIAKTDRTTATARGDPTLWVRSGASIYLYPTPGTTGDTMTIYYKKRPTVLATTAVTEIGPEWDEPILNLAANKAFTWLHEYEKADKFKKEFTLQVASLVDVYYEEEKARRDYIHVDPSYNQFEY